MDHDMKDQIRPDWRPFLFLFLVNNVLRMLLFYGNAYILIPRFAYKAKYWQYAFILIGALGFMLLIDKLIFILALSQYDHTLRNFFVFNLPYFLFILVSSTAFRMIRDKIVEDQRNKERETENLKTELSFLRSQVSPHFMFNVLNNMVALARKKSDALEPSLIKLSSLLRYMLYETDEDKVPLEKEVDYLRSYIDLQQQRFGKNISIHVNFPALLGSHNIEPMLLIPFVENAFKHGSGMIADATIMIDLSVNAQVLEFTVRNKYNPNADEPKDKTSGIGLVNVRRRLDLLYRDNYVLDIIKDDDWFAVRLKLNLH
jgi:LytS/YehU family sensor histidine kinase